VEAVFLRILNMSLSGTFVIAAVLIARLILRRAPRWRFLLWAIVAVRLLIPFSIELTHSPVPVRAEPIPADIGMMAVPQIDSGIVPLDEAVNAILPPAADVTASVNPMQIWIFAGTVIWLGGAVLLAAADALSLILLRRRLRGAVRLEDNLWLADGISSPFVWGLFRPRIYIPSSTPQAAIPFIAAHERAHIRRLDPLWKGIACGITALHWFNPAVWIAYVLFVSDMESACDEAVLSGSAEDIRAAYSEALLSAAAGRSFFTALPPSFGESDPKRRIRNVLRYKRATRWAIAAAACVTALVTVACAFSLAEESRENNVTDLDGADGPLDITYALTFPAYSDVRTQNYVTICAETAPFTVTLTLPPEWTIGAPQNFDAPVYDPVNYLISPLVLYRDGDAVGSIGFYPITLEIPAGGAANEHFLACHRLMMGNYNRWDSEDSYEQIKSDGTVRVGICDILRRLDAADPAAAADYASGAAMPTLTTQGIVAYDTELRVMIGIELYDGAAADAQYRMLAESIMLTAGGEAADWAVPTMQTAQITFPAYQGGRTVYNASIYDTPPFTLTMQIPLGWTMRIPAPDRQTATLPFTAVDFYYGQTYMGSAGFMTFEMYEGITPQDEGFYRMVYNQLMIGNVVTWDTEYTPVQSTQTATFCAATCRVNEPIFEEGVPMAGLKRRQREAIVAYDTEMLVYIAMDFAEGALTAEQWQAMAESVRLAWAAE